MRAILSSAAHLPRRRYRALGRAISIMLAASIAAAIGACGSAPKAAAPAGASRSTGAAAGGSSAQTQGAKAPARLLVSLDPHHLPSPVSGEAAVATGDGVLSLGGLDSTDVSTDRVVRLDPSGGAAHTAGRLGAPLHDAAAATLGPRVLLFGGGAASELDTVQALSGTRNAGAAPAGTGASGAIGSAAIGHLPGTRSDLSAVSVGAAVYLLGGYDGSAPNASVLRTSDGSSFTTFARLPVPFRYAAVAALGTKVYAFGGETASGGDSDAIQLLDTATGQARLLGHLPRAISHASAVALGGRVYVLGGRAAGTPLRQVLAFDPATGVVRSAGELPLAVTNGAAATAGGRGWLLGGLGSEGRTLDTIVELRLG